MGISFSQRYVVALNFLLIGLIAYFAALTVNDVIARRLADSASAEPWSARRVDLKPSALRRESYSVIAQRDIFNSIKQAAPLAPPPVVAQDLNIRLLGTSHLTQSRPFAIVENQRTAQQSLYRQGDEIEGVGRLVAIEKTRIIVEHEGQRLAVEIPQEDMQAPAAVSPPGPNLDETEGDEAPPDVPVQPPTSSARGVHPMGLNRYQLDRSTVDSNLNNMSQLLTQMRAIPNVQNGKSNGFSLSEIQPGSLFSQMGLRDGDLVTTISGQDLNDPTQAMAMLNQLRNQQNIQIGVVRNGRPVVLNYSIH
jgi:general secretion pathway protein C